MATVLLLILFVFVGAIVCIRRRAMLNTPETYHVSTAETGIEKNDPSKYYPNPYNEKKGCVAEKSNFLRSHFYEKFLEIRDR